MNIVEERTPVQIDLDERICSHISRGNKKAYEIISKYHMREIAKIRNYMLDVLHTDYLYDARALNATFHMAIAELGVNLEMLLTETVQVVSTNKKAAKLAV